PNKVRSKITTPGSRDPGVEEGKQLGFLRGPLPARYPARPTRPRGADSIKPGRECTHVTCSRSLEVAGLTKSVRKEVIQPQVLLRLPCYDLVPVTDLAVG